MNEPQDNELLELCNKVHEKTGWDDKKFFYLKGLSEPIYLTQLPPHASEEIICPLYTSDYLLEKLPHVLNHKKDKNGRSRFLTLSKGSMSAIARYGTVDDPAIWVRADTPLKALLKLVLALSKEGKLS
jgi:hypothetical protein